MDMFSSGSQAAQPALPTQPEAPRPVLAPQGSKPKKKPSQPTFLGSGATPGGEASGTPSGNMGGKTLIGS